MRRRGEKRKQGYKRRKLKEKGEREYTLIYTQSQQRERNMNRYK